MRQRCESCPTKLDCVSAFGVYWSEKSGGSVGCEHPFKYRRAEGANVRTGKTGGKPEEAVRRWR